jgi:hypothetical protein
MGDDSLKDAKKESRVLIAVSGWIAGENALYGYTAHPEDDKICRRSERRGR